MVNIGFIGCGNMGTAIMKGILKSKMNSDVKLYAFDKSQQALEKAVEAGVFGAKDAAEVVARCKYVFFAIKPQQLDEVLDEVASQVTADTVIVSILAGVTAEYYAKRTVDSAKVVLVMPNTPFLLGEGATALSRSETVTDEKALALIKATKAFGAMSADYFYEGEHGFSAAYNEYLTQSGLTDADIVNNAKNNYATEFTTDDAKISLVLDEKTAIRLYVKGVQPDGENLKPSTEVYNRQLL